MILVYASKKSVEAVAFADGLRANGKEVRELSASDYGKGQVLPCEAVVITGTRGKGALILDDHRHIPVIVIDYGYLDRVSGIATWQTGHWQVGIGGLNRPPAFPCPGNRLYRLGTAPKQPRGGDYPVVLGQHSGDPSHGLSDSEMIKWAQAKCDEIGGYWRPHPDSPHIRVDAPRAGDDWLARASEVHTLCSTGGLEALIDGVPAIAAMPERASWGELSGPVHPGADAVRDLCQRLAYGQWTLEEMRSGEAPAFVLANMERWNG